MLMERLRVDEVARDSAGVVVVRGSQVESDGRTIPAQVIVCGLYAPDRWYLATQDQTLMTDDRMPVDKASATLCLQSRGISKALRSGV
jgi:hypothetical protein